MANDRPRAWEGGMRGAGLMRGRAVRQRPGMFAGRYLAARALPIIRANVTERPQQLPVDMFGYVCA